MSTAAPNTGRRGPRSDGSRPTRSARGSDPSCRPRCPDPPVVRRGIGAGSLPPPPSAEQFSLIATVANANAVSWKPVGGPELITSEMAAWAAYLRGQADALALPIVDKSRLDPAAATTDRRNRRSAARSRRLDRSREAQLLWRDMSWDRPSSVLSAGAAAIVSAVLRIEHDDPRFRSSAKFASAARRRRGVTRTSGGTQRIMTARYRPEFVATLWQYPGTGGWVFAPVPDKYAPRVAHPWASTPVRARDRRWPYVEDERLARQGSPALSSPCPRNLRGIKGDGDQVRVRLEFNSL